MSVSDIDYPAEIYEPPIQRLYYQQNPDKFMSYIM